MKFLKENDKLKDVKINGMTFSIPYQASVIKLLKWNWEIPSDDDEDDNSEEGSSYAAVYRIKNDAYYLDDVYAADELIPTDDEDPYYDEFWETDYFYGYATRGYGLKNKGGFIEREEAEYDARCSFSDWVNGSYANFISMSEETIRG